MQKLSPDDTTVSVPAASELLTLDEAATALKVSVRTVYRMVDDGLLEMVRIPHGRRLVPRVVRADVQRRIPA